MKKLTKEQASYLINRIGTMLCNYQAGMYMYDVKAIIDDFTQEESLEEKDEISNI